MKICNIAFIMILISSLPVLSQSSFRLSAKESKMIIHGTSTLHPWQCQVEQISGQLIADTDGINIKEIKSLTLNATVSSIRSVDEKGQYYEKGMDKNVYKALKEEKFPTIAFTLTKVNKKTGVGKNIAYDVTGTLRVTGVTKEITIHATATSVAGGVQFEGKLPLKMTDYNVEPPTAIFGTIQTGNEISLVFKIMYLLSSATK